MHGIETETNISKEKEHVKAKPKFFPSLALFTENALSLYFTKPAPPLTFLLRWN
jgi:hypothetical protein